MGGDPLVELDQLVALRTAEAAPAGELVEPSPVGRVREHVGVEVHAGQPMLAAMSEPGPTFASLTADDHVTGEAVALDLPPASLGARIVSGLIDVLVTLAALVVVILAPRHRGPAVRRGPGARGRSSDPHRRLPGAPHDGGDAHPRPVARQAGAWGCARCATTPADHAQHAFVRALIGFVEIYVFSGVPAFFSAMLSPKGKRLGDYAAGTYVVRSRVRLQLAPPALMPPELARWARTADMSALPTGLALAVRQYLGRQATLDPQHRHEMGIRLADLVAAHVAPPPPPGTSPQAYLAAVVASRRERDLVRLRRDAALRDRLTARR